MSTENRKIQIEAGLDASGVKQGAQEVKQAVSGMADVVAKEANRASNATAKMGDGGQQASEKVDRSTKSMIASIQRLTAQMEAGGRTSAKYYETLAQQRGVDPSSLRPYLDQLEQVRAKQEQANAALLVADDRFNKYGMTAKQTTAALRGVPAQLTDIFVSLQGGQAPLTVLLQQGGQLKDMFGGIVPAARALGSAVVGLINPYTLAAAAVGGLYMAYRAGASEAEAFEKALIMTGNRVGTTASELSKMAATMDAVYGTQSKAAKSLAEFAGATGIAKGNFEQFATAAMKWEDATGTAVSETVKQFEALGKAPVAASLKLNESMNYLTASVYEQIKALEESGRTTEAAELAQRTFSDTIESRAPRIVEQLGYIERAWRFIKSSTFEAIDAANAYGRNTIADQISKLEGQLAQAQAQSGSMYLGNPRRTKELEREIALLKEKQAVETSAAELSKFLQDKENDRIAASRYRDEYLGESDRQTQSEQRLLAIAKEKKAFENAVAGIAKDSKEYERIYSAHKTALLNIDKQFEEKKKSGGIKTTDTELANLRAAVQAEEARAKALMTTGLEQSKLNQYELEALKYAEKIKLATDSKTKAQLEFNKQLAEQAGASRRAADDQERQLKEQAKTTESVRKQTQSLQDQIDTFGLGKSAIEELTIARLEDRLVIEEGRNANELVINGIREEIAARRELMGNMRTKEALDLQLKEWEQWEKDVGQIFQQVGQSLTDAIFEGGKSGRDLVEDLFKTLTLRVLINPVLGAIQGQITQSLGSAFGYNNPAVGSASNSKNNGMFGMDFNQFMGGSVGNNLSSFGGAIGSPMVAEFGAGLTAGSGGVFTDAGATAFMNIGTEGSQSFTAGSELGGAGLGSALGYASALYSLSQEKYGSAIGTAIGTYIMPGVGTAIGGMIGGIADGLFGDKEPATRQGQWEWADMTGGEWGIRYRDDRQPAGTGEAITQYARSAVDSANAMLGKLGVDAAIEHFFATTNSSWDGKLNGVASGGSIRAGDSVSEFGLMGLGGDRTMYGYGGWSEAEMLPRLQTDIQLSILEAFQTQVDSLPKVLADMIGGVNVRALDAAGAQAVAEQFNAIITGVDMLRESAKSLPFEQLRDLSFDAAANLIQFAGGLENLNANLGTYFENFYSDAEKQQKVWNDISKALGDVGLATPETRDAFRRLVEAQDLTTEAGQRAYTALLNVSGAFASVTQSSDQLAQAAAERAKALEQAEQDRIASIMSNLESAYSAVVAAGEAEIAKLRESFSMTDSAMNNYRTAVQKLESEFGTLFSSIDGYIKQLRSSSQASAMEEYRRARAIISTALVTRQLPETGSLNDALQVAQRGVTGQAYASRYEQERAYAILANEMEALKGIAQPELDTAKATLEQLEKQYSLLRGTNMLAEESLSVLESQLRSALQNEQSARSQIGLIEQELSTAKQQYEELTGIKTAIVDLATAMREFAAAAAAARTVVVGGGGGGGGGVSGGGTYTTGWTPDNLPSGASNLSAAEKYVLYNEDLLIDQATSGMSVEQYANYHWNTYGQYEDRDIKYRAMGGYTPPGLTWVGEEGPELVNFKQPAMVYTAAQSANLLRGSANNDSLVAEVRGLREEVSMLRYEARATAINTGKQARIMDDVTQGGTAIRTEVAA